MLASLATERAKQDGAAPAVESAPAIKAACVTAGKGRVKLPPADHMFVPCASANCPMVRS